MLAVDKGYDATRVTRMAVDLHYERVAGGTHDEAAWAGRMAPILSFLFPAVE